MQIPIFTVDAFTNRPFCGNPAAVCLLENVSFKKKSLKKQKKMYERLQCFFTTPNLSAQYQITESIFNNFILGWSFIICFFAFPVEEKCVWGECVGLDLGHWTCRAQLLAGLSKQLGALQSRLVVLRHSTAVVLFMKMFWTNGSSWYAVDKFYHNLVTK